jgi:hypothetical protein
MKTTLLITLLALGMLAGCMPDALIADTFPYAWKAIVFLVGLAFARVTIGSVFLKGLLTRFGAAADMVVLEVEQVYVDRITAGRADGKLTEFEANEARGLALAKLKSYIGGKGLELLAFVVGVSKSTIEDLRGTAVEASVKKLTMAQKASGAKGPPR